MCETYGQYLTATEAHEMSSVGMSALHFYLAAANLARLMSVFSWIVLPKAHVFDHINADLVTELYNVRWCHNFGAEDFMGVLKTICSRCAGKGMALQVLRRTLLRLVAAKPLDGWSQR